MALDSTTFDTVRCLLTERPCHLTSTQCDEIVALAQAARSASPPTADALTEDLARVTSGHIKKRAPHRANVSTLEGEVHVVHFAPSDDVASLKRSVKVAVNTKKSSQRDRAARAEVQALREQHRAELEAHIAREAELLREQEAKIMAEAEAATKRQFAALGIQMANTVQLYHLDGTELEQGALEKNGCNDECELTAIVKGGTPLTDETIRDALQAWCDPKSKDEVAAEFGEIEDWDVGAVTNMAGLFFGLADFNCNISAWDVSSVTDMSDAFTNTNSFNQPLGSWDVSSVTDMSSMFSFAESFNQPLEAWNVSNVKHMQYMFLGADAQDPRPSWA